MIAILEWRFHSQRIARDRAESDQSDKVRQRNERRDH